MFELRALVAQILDVFEILGQFAVAGDDGALDDVGESVLVERLGRVRLEHVVDVRQQQIAKEIGRLARQLRRHVVDRTHQHARPFETVCRLPIFFQTKKKKFK